MISKLKLMIKHDDTQEYLKNRSLFLKCSDIRKYFYYVKCKRIEKRNNAEIGLQFKGKCASFLSDPLLPHGLNGIIISYKASFGENVTIMHRVTVGTKMVQNRVRQELKAPRIGNNVYIGTGAVVIGDIEVGENVIIGANAVVTKDVPANMTAVGAPAKYFPINNEYKKER